MRVFYAFLPDVETRARLAAAGDALPLSSMARRTAPEDLHLTLAFLGDVAAPQLSALQQVGRSMNALPRASEHSEARRGSVIRSCRIEFGRYEFWPEARVIVAAASASSVAAGVFSACLRERIAQALPEQRFDPAPLRAHVTLARKIAHASDWTAILARPPATSARQSTTLARPPAVGGRSSASAAAPADASSMAPFTWCADTFSLLRSNGSHAASRYTVLDTWPLLYE